MNKGVLHRRMFVGVVLAAALVGLNVVPASAAPAASTDPTITIPNVTDGNGNYGLKKGDTSAGVAPSAMCPTPEALPSPKVSETPAESPGASPSASASSNADLVSNQATASPSASASASATEDADCLKWPIVTLTPKGKCAFTMNMSNPNNSMVPFQLWLRVAPDAAAVELTVLAGAWFPANYKTGTAMADFHGVETGGTIEIWVGLWFGRKQQITYGELRNFHFSPTDCPAPKQEVVTVKNDDGSSASTKVQLAEQPVQTQAASPSASAALLSETLTFDEASPSPTAAAMQPVSADSSMGVPVGIVLAAVLAIACTWMLVAVRRRYNMQRDHL